MGLGQWKGWRYLCHRDWIAKFLEVVMYADDLGHVIDPLVQDYVK